MKILVSLRVAFLGALFCSVAGCASPSPSPAATHAADSPQIVCRQSTRPGALDCHQALAVAISDLPPGDRPIRASFEYGTYCGSTSGCGFSPQANRVDFGLVYFSYAGSGRQKYIYIAADADGKPRLAGQLSSSPPPLMSVPTPIPSGQ
jgi:hypothetical protein